MFDTIDHDIFIDRLQNYTGIQEQALRWFRSYLSDRYHFVYLNEESSQLEILLENMGLVSIVLLMILNYLNKTRWNFYII